MKLRDLHDAWGVGEENAAATQGRLGVGHDLPRLGEVEDDAIEIGLVDSCVDIADLCPVALEGLSTRKRALRCGRAARSLLEARIRRCRRRRATCPSRAPRTRALTPAPGPRGRCRHGSGSGRCPWVHDLCAAWHLQDEVGDRRADRDEHHAPARPVRLPFRLSDHFVVREHPECEWNSPPSSRSIR